MKTHDQILLENVYSLVKEEQQIFQELNNLLIQEGIWDAISGAVQSGTQAVADKVSGTIQNSAQAISNTTDLTQKIQTWSQQSLPEYISKIGDFVTQFGWQFLGGTAGTYVLGQFLMFLSKKMGKEAEQNYDALKSMLPSVVQDKIKEIEHLKTTNPQEYKLKVFEINKTSLVELKKQLNSKGIKTDKGVLSKTLDYLGKFLSSTAGSLAGGLIIPILIYKLGFNPLPIFPLIK